MQTQFYCRFGAIGGDSDLMVSEELTFYDSYSFSFSYRTSLTFENKPHVSVDLIGSLQRVQETVVGLSRRLH